MDLTNGHNCEGGRPPLHLPVDSGATWEPTLGALALAISGNCCLDGFDKMSEATQSALHEMMEQQQTLNIVKTDIISQLNARISPLVTAIPYESRVRSPPGPPPGVTLLHC